jgi:hypothetical protein
MDVARRVMRHRQFKAVRDALRTKLQFRDVLYRDEIERVARSATGSPGAEPPSNGSPRTDVATSARRSGSMSSAVKVASAALGVPRQTLAPAGVPRPSEVV